MLSRTARSERKTVTCSCGHAAHEGCMSPLSVAFPGGSERRSSSVTRACTMTRKPINAATPGLGQGDLMLVAGAGGVHRRSADALFRRAAVQADQGG